MDNVIPKDIIKKVRLIELKTRRAVDSILSGGYHSAFKGKGMQFSEVRAYIPGDDVRNIDWNVTARSHQPFVKVFQEERELTVMLVVDASASLQFGTIRSSKQDVAAEISAMLSLSAIKNNDNVGLLMFSDREETFIPPRKGRNHVLQVLRQVLYAMPQGRRTRLGAALERLAKVTKKKSLIFILSDFLDDQWSRPLMVLSRHHDVIPVVIRDRMEYELPDLGLVQFYDPEQGQDFLVDTSDKEFRKRYLQDRQNDASRLEKVFRSSGIEPIFVRSDVSHVHALMKYFRYRENRR